MDSQREFPLRFADNFGAYLLGFANTQPPGVGAPFAGCFLQLSTTPLNFASRAALQASVTYPVFDGYGDAGPDNFGVVIKRGSDGYAIQLPKMSVRVSDLLGGGVPVDILGVAIFNGLGTGYFAGAVFNPPVPVVDVGDGFAVIVEITVINSVLGGRVVVLQ